MAFWPDGYASKQRIRTKDQQGRDLVFQSGIAVFDFKGTGSSWKHDQLWILTDAAWQGMPTVQAIASLASISNLNTAVNAGWASDDIGIAIYNGRILLQVTLAVRDSDGYVHRIAYHTTGIGTLSGW